MKIKSSMIVLLFLPWFVMSQPIETIRPQTYIISRHTTGGMGFRLVWNSAVKGYYAVVFGTGERGQHSILLYSGRDG